MKAKFQENVFLVTFTLKKSDFLETRVEENGERFSWDGEEMINDE